MPGSRPSVKNEKQYEGLKRKGMSKETAQKREAGRKGGRAAAKR